MKKIRYTLLALLACLTWGGCEDVEDPVRNIPELTLSDMEKYGSTYAYFEGTINQEAEIYFQVSTSENMADAIKVPAYLSDVPMDGVYTCYGETGELAAGTTYYYTLCATDGRSEVRSEVKSFTTVKTISVASVTWTPWGQEEEVPFTSDNPMSTILADTEAHILSYGGTLRYDEAKGTWDLSQEFPFPNRPANLHTFWPSEQTGEEIMFISYGTDYLYGCSVDTVGMTQPAAHIRMKHALAKLNFNFTKMAGSSIDDEAIRVIVQNTPTGREKAYPVIALNGTLNYVSGIVSPSEDKSHDGMFLECGFQPDAEKAATVSTLALPAKFVSGDAQLLLDFNNGYTLSWIFTDTSWESGKEYTYNFEIGMTDLYLTGVTVTEWDEENGGTIIVTK